MSDGFLFRNLRRAAPKTSKVSEPVPTGGFGVRRRSRAPTESPLVRLQLVDVDGVLEWEDVTNAGPALRQVRRRGRAAAPDGALADVQFRKLAPSEITEFLANRDAALTPSRGLRRWDATSGELRSSEFPAEGRTLVFIHGTFSNGDNVFKTCLSTPHGRQFLQDAVEKYEGRVYSFDHATLSESPVLNALDFETSIGRSKAQVDIISHSRGGLVARWWTEAFDRGDRCRRVVMVGSPLAGTGLAAPPNIRRSIQLLTNFGKGLGMATAAASAAVPVLAVVHTLLQITTSIASWTAKVPIVDALVAMVPGLFAQSRVGNNQELLRMLERNLRDSDRYYLVAANFESDDPGWRFWRHFRKTNLADRAADAVFDGDNDLVVDTCSMNSLGKKVVVAKPRLLDFGRSNVVHHLNYFEQSGTTDFLRGVLGL